MVIEVVLGSLLGSFLGGVICYYEGYRYGLKSSKKYILIRKNNNLGFETIESSKPM